MSLLSLLFTNIPESFKKVINLVRNRFISKYDSEMFFWKSRNIIDNGKFKNSHYSRIMLSMAEEPNDGFLNNKVVADFGCGPRGSLVWAKSALIRIGIDVLADQYADKFKDNIITHGMIYVKSTEEVIPLPSDFIDIIFTLNAMDHVDNFPVMCSEILRVLKTGGILIGSFNLEEPPTSCEPQKLSMKIIKENLLDKMEILSYRITEKGPKDNLYAPFFSGNLSYRTGEEGYLWVKARKNIVL